MNCINRSLYLALSLFIVVISTGRSNAVVWKGIRNDFKGDPILAVPIGSDLGVLFDNGLSAKGRQYSVQLSNGIFWRHLLTFHADSASVVRDMIMYNRNIYIAGSIKNIAEVNKAVNIFKYNLANRTYESLTTSSQDLSKFKLINQLAIFNGKLLAVGTFTAIDNTSGNNVLAFDGRNWSAAGTGLGTGFSAPVTNVLIDNDSMFFSGFFTKANGKESQFFATNYNGEWTYYPKNEVRSGKGIVFKNQKIYIGINPNSKPGIFTLAKDGLRDNSKGINSVVQVTDLTIFDGDLYASGIFRMDGVEEVQSLIIYKDGVWETVQGGNTLINIKALASFRSKLFALGKFSYERLGINKIATFQKNLALIGGNVFYDKNNNCRFDARDEILDDVVIEVTPGPYFAKPDPRGYYKLLVPSGSYTVRVIGKNYWTSTDCSRNQFKIEIQNGQIKDSVDFARTYDRNVEDVRVSLSSSGGWQARNGQRQVYIVSYENLGSERIDKGKIDLKFNQRVGAQAIFPDAPDNLETNQATWNYENLMPGETRKIAVAFLIPENLPEKELEFEAIIEQAAGETEIDDNQADLTQTVSADDFHNDKQVYPSPIDGHEISYIDPNVQNDLVYSINFSNYSTDTVRTVYIIDTIDVNLDIRYIQELGASHTYSTEVINGPIGSNYAVILWTFKDIELSPNPNKEFDKIGYSGFINFKVNLSSGTPYGTIVSNTATIVFDNEIETVTNTVQTQLQKSLSTTTSAELNGVFSVYPNPCNDVLNIRKLSGPQIVTSCKMFNQLGQEQFVYRMNDQIKTAQLATGVYHLLLESESGIARFKILVQH